MTNYAWMTVKDWTPGHPDRPRCKEDIILPREDIEKFCAAFALDVAAIDMNHGMLRVSGFEGPAVYSVMIEARAAQKVAKAFPANFDGPWQNYNIGPVARGPQP
jgi:hypothetical protein